MSWLSTALHNNSKILKPIAVGAGTLLGSPALGAAIAGGWNYADNHDLGKAALDAGTTFGLGNLAKGASKLPGISSVTDRIGDAGRYLENNIPGLSTLADKVGDVGSWAHRMGGDVQSSLAKAGIKLPSLAALTGGGGAQGSGLDSLLGLGSVANSAYLQDKANNFANLAAQNVDRAYSEKDPLRKAGIAGMQAAPVTLPALAKIRQQGNPFAG